MGYSEVAATPGWPDEHINHLMRKDLPEADGEAAGSTLVDLDDTYSLEIQVGDDLSEPRWAKIDAELNKHNQEVAPPAETTQVGIFARRGDGGDDSELVGGCYAFVTWGRCFVYYIFVESSVRRQAIGR